MVYIWRHRSTRRTIDPTLTFVPMADGQTASYFSVSTWPIPSGILNTTVRLIAATNGPAGYSTQA